MLDDVLLIGTQGVDESVKNESALWLGPDPFQRGHL